MSTSNNIQSYEDCFGVLDEAMASENGIRAGFDTWGAATHFRLRLNRARQLDRKLQAEIYPDPMDPRHNRTDYDRLNFRVIQEDGRAWVYVERRATPKIEGIKPRGEEPRVVPEGVTRMLRRI